MLAQYAVSGVGLALSAHLLLQLVEPPLVITLRLHALSFLGLTGMLWRRDRSSVVRALAASMTLSVSYVLALVSSVAIYRLYIHRLRKLPGDTLSKLTMLSWLGTELEGRRPLLLQELHRKHGPVVRVGPREVSVADYRACRIIYGPGSTCRRVVQPTPSQKNGGSSDRVYTSQETLTQTIKEKMPQQVCNVAKDIVNKLFDRLASMTLREIDLADWIERYCFDVASTLVIGSSLDRVGEEGAGPAMLTPLEDQRQLNNLVGRLPWLLDAVQLLPSKARAFHAWVKTKVEEQKPIKDPCSSLASILLTGEAQTENRMTVEDVAAQLSTFLLGSSATATASAIWCLLELLHHPPALSRFQHEIRDVFGTAQADDLDKLRDDCPFLNACIRESLRLWPPIPCGARRVTGTQGLQIDRNNRLPADIFVSVPTYTVQRDAANFSSPDEFQPTRWLPEAGSFTCDRGAFIPLAHDSAAIEDESSFIQCRLILARLFQSFNVASKVHNDSDKDASFDSRFREQYTVLKTPLLVKLEPIR